LIRQRIAFCLPLLDELPRLIDAMDQLAVLINFETSSVERVQSFPMPIEISSAILQQHVGKIIKPPLRRNLRFKLSHSARCGISRIRENGEPFAFTLLIHSLERSQRHQQFATHLKI